MRHTRYSRRSFKSRYKRQRNESKFIKEGLELPTNLFNPIKRSKLKLFESANKKVIVKASDKRLLDYKQ